MIEKEDVQRIKNVKNFDQFERAVLENINAIENVGKKQILVPVNQGDDGYHMAVVEVEEEELRNLSEAWAEEMQ
mgnify:CR=1 FL=1